LATQSPNPVSSQQSNPSSALEKSSPSSSVDKIATFTPEKRKRVEEPEPLHTEIFKTPEKSSLDESQKKMFFFFFILTPQDMFLQIFHKMTTTWKHLQVHLVKRKL
jgi:hypothetical protein